MCYYKKLEYSMLETQNIAYKSVWKDEFGTLVAKNQQNIK